MRRRFFGVSVEWAAVLAAALVLAGPAAPAGAITEAEQTFLAMYLAPEELRVVSATRSLKSINRVAENVHVVSAAEIASLHAHSLAEVLETVTGLAIERRGGPGSVFSPYIQGSSFTQVAAFLDGIPLNNLAGSFPELTFLPVEEIARIEVVKGPASSAWGSALGGVINIITKRPPETGGRNGALSASAGTAATTDLRASVAGRSGSLGYGLWAGRLHSDALTDGYEVARSSVTAKLDYRPDPAWNVGLAVYWTGSDRGEGLWPDYDEADRSEADHLRAQVTAESHLPGGGLLSLNLWGADNRDDYIMESISDGSEFARSNFDDRMGGGGLRYRRSIAGHELVIGADALGGRTESVDLPETVRDHRWAVYANDTFDVGPATVTAGLRRDELKRAGSFWAPSLGAVLPVGGHLLLRADVSRGFTAPVGNAGVTNEAWGYLGNPDLVVEKVASYQVGVEGDAPGLFWYKLTAFRHDVKDAITVNSVDDATWTYVNRDRVRRQGVELDARSAAFHGVTLEAGAALLDTENRTASDDGEWFADATFRVAARWDGPRGLRALLDVRRTHWDVPEGFDVAADPVVDLHVGKEFTLAGVVVEAFGAGHNLFDGDQYFDAMFPNPGRWLEAGLACRF